jgi:hypothetical protein
LEAIPGAFLLHPSWIFYNLRTQAFAQRNCADFRLQHKNLKLVTQWVANDELRSLCDVACSPDNENQVECSEGAFSRPSASQNDEPIERI